MNRRKTFLVAASVTVGVLALLMLLPFAGYLLAGIVLAFVLHPLHERTRKRLGDSVSALTMVLITVLAAVLPFTVVLAAVANDAGNLVSQLQGLEIPSTEVVEQLVFDLTGTELDLDSRLSGAVEKLMSFAAGSVTGLLGAFTDAAIGISLMLFLQFYTIRDGRRFVEWTKRFDVMKDGMQQELYDRAASSTWAVVKGHVFIAAAMGLLVGLGFVALGVPNPFFWTFAMVLLGFIPLVGTAFVWVPASAYLVLQGEHTVAAVLFVYSLLVSTLADNFLRPFLVDEDADIHPFFIIAGVVGGLGVFGAVGIFLGPVTFGVLKTLLNMMQESYQEL